MNDTLNMGRRLIRQMTISAHIYVKQAAVELTHPQNLTTS
ncbi:MAG: hypothetical protein JWO78_10 [Micavibrio sp.]|nr:hypothetical protein [Micavibrio sp.]